MRIDGMAQRAPRPGLLARLWKRKGDVLAALVWALWASVPLARLLIEPSVLLAGMFVFTLMAAILFAIRRPALVQGRRRDFWLAAATTMLPPLTMRAAPGGWPAIGVPVQLVGLALTMVALGTLNRSLGVAPANRGLVTRGLYGVVRHPLYASELLSLLGFCLGYASLWNWAWLLATAAGQLLRIRAEERLLADDFGYPAYRARVRWRLVPGLW